MKSIVAYLIKKRNPNFRFDEAINNRAFWDLVSFQAFGVLRGLKLFFKLKNPKMASLGAGVTFFNAPKIQFGRFLKLGKHVHISALGKQGVVLGDNVGIGAFSQVVVSTTFNNLGEFIKIGNHVGIGEFAYLGGAGGLEIGDECIIGQYFSCHPENHNADNLELPIRHQGVSRKGIKIGKNCWIGSKVTVLDGVEIGDGCIVAAGAVVNKSFPANSIIGGVPAKILKDRA